MWTSAGVGTRVAVYLGMVVVAGGTVVVFPLFPALQADLRLPTAAVGLVAAAGFLAGVLVELLVAPLADRGRARAMAAGGVALVAVSLAWSALAASAAELVAARAVGGAGSGLFLPAVAAVLIRSDPARAGESLGRLATAELAGIAVGPLLAAGLLELLPVAGVFAVTAAITALVAVPVLLGVRDRADVPPGDGAGRRARPPRLGLDLLESRQAVGAVLLTVAVMVPVGAYDAVWPRYLADLSAGPLLIGASYAVFALPFMLVAAHAGRLSDRIGGPAAFTRGIGLLLAMVALYAVLRDAWAATGVGLLESTGQAYAFVGAAAAMAQAVDAARAGAGQGLARAAGTLAAAAAAAVSGVAYAAGGPAPLFLGTAAVVALVAAAGVALSRAPRPLPATRWPSRRAGDRAGDPVTGPR